MSALAACVLLFAGCGGNGNVPCEVGEAGCACAAAASCNEGLVCVESTGMCAAQRWAAFDTVDSRARSCEVLLADTDTSVADARFGGGVVGTIERRSPLSALAFHAGSDTAMRGGDIEVSLLGAGTAEVVSTRCFDASGEIVAGSLLEFQ